MTEGGEARLGQRSAVIAGLARDCAPYLAHNLATIEAIAGLFARAHHLLLESDSADDSLARLRDWHEPRAARGVLESYGRLARRHKHRTERLAFLRNEVLARCRAAPEFAEADYLILLDLDNVNSLLTADGLARAFRAASGLDWAGFFANQSVDYYDIWALRHPEWSPDDCWRRVDERPAFMSREAAVKLYVLGRHMRIAAKAAPIEVDSAFGGLGVYRMKAALGSRYVGLDADGRQVCEHVAFHAGIRAAGGRLYILPGLINHTGLDDEDRPKPGRWARLRAAIGAG